MMNEVPREVPRPKPLAAGPKGFWHFPHIFFLLLSRPIKRGFLSANALGRSPFYKKLHQEFAIPSLDYSTVLCLLLSFK